MQHRDSGTTFTFPIKVAEDGTVTHDALDYDPYKLPWVTGAEDTLPGSMRAKYPEGRTDLNEKLAVLKSKRAQNGAAPRPYVWGEVSGTDPLSFENPDWRIQP